MKYLILILLLCSACSLQNINRASLGAASASLACDWAQTRSTAETRWADGSFERNPIMGARPTTEQVDRYFLGVAILDVALYLVLPKKLRALSQGFILGAQTKTVVGNIDSTGTLCGRKVKI